MNQQHDTSVGSDGTQPGNPSQRETGGSGGAQLTHGINDTNSDAKIDPRLTSADGNRQSDQSGSDATAANRTAQDTRANQAGSTGTGLGAAQTGGNQDEFDMPKE